MVYTDRSLVEKDQLLLLALEYECAKLGQPLPWDDAVKHVKEGASGQAVVQHLAKVRKYRMEMGQPVPPEPLKRRLPKPRQLAGKGSKVLPDDVTDDDEDNYINPFKGSKSRMVFAPIHDPNPKTPSNKITLSQSTPPAPPVLRRRPIKSFKEENVESQEEAYNNDLYADSEDEWKPDEQDVPSAPPKKRRGRPAKPPTEISKVDHEEQESNGHGENQDAERHEFRSTVPAFNATIDRFNRRVTRIKKEHNKQFKKLARNRNLSPENGMVKEQALEDPFTDNQTADANPTEQSEHAEQARKAIVGYDVPWTPALSPPGSPTPNYNPTYQPMMNVPASIAGSRDANIGPLFRFNPSQFNPSQEQLTNQLDIENYNVSRGWTNPLFRPNIGGNDESTPRLWSNPMLNPPVPVGTHGGGAQMLPHDVAHWDWTGGYGSMGVNNDPRGLANASMGVYNDQQGLNNATMGGYNDEQSLANASMEGYNDLQVWANGSPEHLNIPQSVAYGTVEEYRDLADLHGGQLQQFDMSLADANFGGLERSETLPEGGDGFYEANQTIAPMSLSNLDPRLNSNQGMCMGDNNDPLNNSPYGDLPSFAGYSDNPQNIQN